MKTKTATKLAAFLTAVLLSASAQAQTVYQNGFAPAPDAYANLPGVKDPRTLQPKVRYTCHSELGTTGYSRGPYRDVFGSRGLPVQGYRCTDENGISSFGGRNPVSKDWYPGINPVDPTF
ncbi:MAG: hypothetical protein ACT6RN_10115 [Agrobacterium sp.]|uniref:Uncharacterized protein n=1 Tax=Agrobacterium tumefaciens TaxID=358 RepID=A0AAE6EKJ9_AGRTU|nr:MULTISPECIES: hypothetical protein [Rhizobium/Agrobacterium group]KNY32349.1 hypothetical protein AKG12_20030 [Agrobacterium sp. SUL3]MCZ7453525.1 hypothetical protein [Rhizobium rhizogenes]QCM01188.1 hypothetical protein CFBP6624_14290 [Agrobacterium tumefaciens]